MSYRGKVLNGVVVLETGVNLPDGTVVRVEPLAPDVPVADQPSLADDLMQLAGTVPGLPPDYSRNIDHYLYGLPKE